MTIADMKAALTPAGPGKPRLSLIPRAALDYLARALQYGSDKYAIGNFHRDAPSGVSADERLLVYLDAVLRHATSASDALVRARGRGDNLTAAACVQDDDSGLPHLAHLLAAASLAVACAANDGLIPADPGAPWLEALPAPVNLSCDVPAWPAPTNGTHPTCCYRDTELGPICGRHEISLERSQINELRCRLTQIVVEGPPE